jgi:hypothetical protein
MSKHTPGPWAANKPTQSNGRAEVYAGPMLVAQAFNWMLDAEGDEQCWADARLIACAPELLEALKLALFHVANQGDIGVDQWLACERKARAAIAKAEGKV